MRTDFVLTLSHFSAMTEEQLKEVEAIVNREIRNHLPVVVRNMPIEEAKKDGSSGSVW